MGRRPSTTTVLILVLVVLGVAADRFLPAGGVVTALSLGIFAFFAYGFVRDPRMWGPIPPSRKRCFAAWCCAIAALVAVATAITVHEARALPPGRSLTHPTGWALVCVVVILVFAVVGGFAVFTARTPGMFVTIWATLGALTLAIVPGVVVAAMGEEGKNGIVGTCERGASCSAFANGLAGFYANAIELALAVGALFGAAFAGKRILSNRLRPR